MAKSLILVSHGRFCEELKGSTEMIMGPQDNIHAVALLQKMVQKNLLREFEAAIEGWMISLSLCGSSRWNTM